jgi:hypothetical protein
MKEQQSSDEGRVGITDILDGLLVGMGGQSLDLRLRVAQLFLLICAEAEPEVRSSLV